MTDHPWTCCDCNAEPDGYPCVVYRVTPFGHDRITLCVDCYRQSPEAANDTAETEDRDYDASRDGGKDAA